MARNGLTTCCQTNNNKHQLASERERKRHLRVFEHSARVSYEIMTTNSNLAMYDVQCCAMSGLAADQSCGGRRSSLLPAVGKH